MGVAPRPAASRSDETAVTFLAAAAELIDKGFVDAEHRGRHPANALHFPAAIQWLRVEDVLRVAADWGEHASRKAFHNRWPDKDSFIRDAVVFAMCYRDAPGRDPNTYLANAESLFHDPARLLDDTWTFAVAMFDGLFRDPRSFLMIHLTPTIALYPDIQHEVDSSMLESRQLWRASYTHLIERLGLRLTDGWTITSLDLTLQALIDGFLICERARASASVTDPTPTSEKFARAVCAVVAAALTPTEDDTEPGKAVAEVTQCG